MKNYNLIKEIFENNISKKTYTELCLEENSRFSMIVSNDENYCYDDVCKELKTSDSIYLLENEIHFIEFKDVNSSKLLDSKKNRDFIRQLRLKVIESFVTLHNFLNDNAYSITKDELSQYPLKYYFVFNKNQFADKPTLLNAFSAIQSKWTNHYKNFYLAINFIDHETFIKKYNISHD